MTKLSNKPGGTPIDNERIEDKFILKKDKFEPLYYRK